MTFLYQCANLISMICVLMPVAFIVWTYFWVARADVVEGKVIDFKVTTNEKGTRMYAPKVVYEIDCKSQELTSTLKTGFFRFRVGESIKVVVSQDRKRAAIAKYIDLYGIPVAILVFLIFFRIGGSILQFEKTFFFFLHPQFI